MCGLFGIVQKNALTVADIRRADKARDTLAHRGPDNGASWIENGVYMGHRRLSIIDTSAAGNQPMIDDNVVITVNGEIYNFQALRQELQDAGYTFSSHSDSEVVLHGYRHWGLNQLAEKMDGMYVAIIFDRTTNQLMAIRDRVGIKPLYYYFDGQTMVWASELKAVVNYIGRENLAVDNTAVIDFLACRRIPAPKSLFQNIAKLPPAYTLTLDVESGNAAIKRYWQLSLDETNESDEKLANTLVSLLRKSVHEQLVSDVPLGLLLSGGVDSSAIAALASEKQTLHSFSIGFKDSAHDETPYAKQVAEHVGASHHVHYLDDEEMENLPQRMAAWFDEPFGNHSAVPTWRVCEFARKHVTVALSGDGGDELFGGYKWYYRYALLRRWQKLLPFKRKYGFRLPSFLPRKKELELFTIADPIVLYSQLRGGLPYRRLKQWMQRLDIAETYDPYWAYRQHYHADLSPRKAAQVMDFHTYLPDEMLVKVDRVSMAVALECRPPFLSQKVVEFAFSLPESFLYKGGQLKGGLKFALRDLLPHSILHRSKQGFSVPDTGWRKALVKKYGSIQEGIINEFIAI